MKRIIILTIYLLTTYSAFSQAPGMFKYQAVVRDSKGKIMDSENIIVLINILQDSPSGTAVFSETHNTTSTEQGIVNLNIGNSNPSGLSSVEWDSHNYFMQVSINGITMGTTQLLSVPYALYAQSSGSSIPGPQGEQGIEGQSAYEVWINAGNTGTESDFFAFLKGEKGDTGENGNNGKSSYEIWLEQGNSGTQAEFIASLKGDQGDAGFAPGHEWDNTSLRFQNTNGTWGQYVNLKGEQGDKGEQGKDGANGINGKSAYEIWLEQGNSGTLVQFIASLKGEKGDAGFVPGYEWDNTSLRFQNSNGTWGQFVNLKGEKGEKGDPGTNGMNGINGTNGQNGKSSYEIWLEQGNSGTQAQFIASLKGAKGDTGQQGIKGDRGNSPSHQWNGTSLRFQNSDGSWGAYVDLKGNTGQSVNTFAVCVSAREYYSHGNRYCTSGDCNCSSGKLLSKVTGSCTVKSDTGSCSASSTYSDSAALCPGACCVCSPN